MTPAAARARPAASKAKARLDRHRFRVSLKAGVNTVLLKVCQAPYDPDNTAPNWEFLLRITDLTGRGVTFPTALKSR